MAELDWQKITLNLRRVKPLSTIATEIGADWQHLNRLARGDTAQPRFNTGLKLLDKHYEYCPDRHNTQELTI